MCRFSYERCVCFVFLVILAVLSCAGVRVDDLVAMAEIDKQRTSLADEAQLVPQHRLRHHRHPRRVLATPPAPRWLPQQEDDISVRAFRSEVVLLAYAEGSNHSCQFVFRVLKVYKNAKSFPIVDRIMVTLDCEEAVRGYRRKLVKNKIHLRRKYVLFLNASGSSNFQPAGVPKLVRANKEAKTDRIIRHACTPKLVPTTPKIVELKEISRRQADKRKILCKVKGFPVPKIVWRRKGQTLSQNRYLRIQYRRKQSRLTIKKVDADHIGQYECVAEAPNGRIASRTISVSTSTYPSGKECQGPMRTNFCSNGGTCHAEVTMGEYYCICAPGYSGEKCDVKEPSHSRLLTMAYMAKSLGRKKGRKPFKFR